VRLHRAEERRRETGGRGRLLQRQPSLQPAAAQALADLDLVAGPGTRPPSGLLGEDAVDRGSVQPLGAAKVRDAAQLVELLLPEVAIAARRAAAADEALALPDPDRGRADARDARRLTDREAQLP